MQVFSIIPYFYRTLQPILVDSPDCVAQQVISMNNYFRRLKNKPEASLEPM